MYFSTNQDYQHYAYNFSNKQCVSKDIPYSVLIAGEYCDAVYITPQAGDDEDKVIDVIQAAKAQDSFPVIITEPQMYPPVIQLAYLGTYSKRWYGLGITLGPDFHVAPFPWFSPAHAIRKWLNEYLDEYIYNNQNKLLPQIIPFDEVVIINDYSPYELGQRDALADSIVASLFSYEVWGSTHTYHKYFQRPWMS